ncbi:MAG: hypothetical protein NW220_00900 [Leptolyngbyaceae cyanobacterium bins.349]|nr:hypothetical protein [Leptolyngbyaceae cyanobacterium bins.349]
MIKQNTLFNPVAIAVAAAIGVTSAIAPATQAQEALTNGAIRFPEDTVVEFELVDTHGYYQSTFGVVDTTTRQKVPLFVEIKPYDQPNPSVPGRDDTGTTPDYYGTVEGGSVVNGEGQANKFIKYTFKAGVPYVFYMDSVDPRTREVKTSYLSTNNLATRFSGSLVAGETGNLIEWDDSGLPRPGKDNDFDDFAIIAGGFTLGPCPLVR